MPCLPCHACYAPHLLLLTMLAPPQTVLVVEGNVWYAPDLPLLQAMLARWPSWAPRDEYMFINQMAVIAPVMHIGCTQVQGRTGPPFEFKERCSLKRYAVPLKPIIPYILTRSVTPAALFASARQVYHLMLQGELHGSISDIIVSFSLNLWCYLLESELWLIHKCGIKHSQCYDNELSKGETRVVDYCWWLDFVISITVKRNMPYNQLLK